MLPGMLLDTVAGLSLDTVRVQRAQSAQERHQTRALRPTNFSTWRVSELNERRERQTRVSRQTDLLTGGFNFGGKMALVVHELTTPLFVCQQSIEIPNMSLLVLACERTGARRRGV
ncbi:predicted protein [Histoplasma capsulatum G186AR]|uniref:Uncharacterized protein n=1 Tax=Ajellomyces capsulatus (strain G186AR / H82 / ATCC MYA-2454 / RMSCC 2432) TaxID=447093 RepID=C0NRN9_AJECG|nr:uncharacterized protein HCBG_05819 [Histoplasma capsulatum G186AR]EEH05555.1 predicted protein [Histoplasma capsulatum G186AR]